MPQELTYGIEMECYVPASIGQAKVARDLAALGLSAVAAGYGGRQYDRWQVKTDGSLNSPPDGYTGIEVVSPVLTWGNADHEAQVRKVSEYLVSIDAKVNSTCGGHVHLYVGHLSANSIADLVQQYYANVYSIGSGLISRNRARGGTYARIPDPTRTADAAQCVRAYGTDHVYRFGSHMNVINADWYAQRGTLEFRHRDATVNHYKWMGWVGFLVSLVRMAEAESAPMVWANHDQMLTYLVEHEYLSPVLREWAQRRTPSINVELSEQIREARERASAAAANYSRMFALQGIRR